MGRKGTLVNFHCLAAVPAGKEGGLSAIRWAGFLGSRHKLTKVFYDTK